MIAIAKKGFEVNGIDILSNETFIKYENIIDTIKNHNIKIINYDGDNILPFAHNSFDLITSQNVFEHLLDVEDILEEFKRILKPKGRIIIMCPNWGRLNNPIRAAINLIRFNNRYFHFNNFKDILLGFLQGLFFPILIKF